MTQTFNDVRGVEKWQTIIDTTELDNAIRKRIITLLSVVIVIAKQMHL